MIAITGANGFIGKEVVKLLSKKDKLRCLVLKGEDTAELKGYGVEIVYGDILDKNTLISLVKGSKCVVHLAAIVTSTDAEKIYQINLDGTRNIVEACKKNKVKRILFTSSIAAVAENLGPYGKSKIEAEKVIQESGLEYTILRPTLVYGKNGPEFNELVSTIKKLPVIPLIGGAKGKKNPVYVSDLAELIVRIIYSEKSINKVYEIGGLERLSFAELISLISQDLGVKRFRVHVPSFIGMIFALVLKKILKNPPLTKDQVVAFGNDAVADMSSLKKDFDFKPMPFKEGLKKSLQQ